MDPDETSASSTTKAPRLPAAQTQARRSLSHSELPSLPAADRAAVDHLLAMPALDED